MNVLLSGEVLFGICLISGQAHRHEGDRIGINDKGLVTFDRKVRKRCFLFL